MFVQKKERKENLFDILGISEHMSDIVFFVKARMYGVPAGSHRIMIYLNSVGNDYLFGVNEIKLFFRSFII